MADEPKKGLSAPIDVVRRQLLDDEDTQAIAKNLGLELEEYVEMVLDFAQNPDKEPLLEYVPDEELEAMGAEVPTKAGVLAWFKGVESGEIDLGPKAGVIQDQVDHAAAQERARRAKLQAAVGNTAPEFVAPKVGVNPQSDASSDEMGSVLKQQLLAQRSAGKPPPGASKEPRKPQKAQPKPKPGR